MRIENDLCDGDVELEDKELNEWPLASPSALSVLRLRRCCLTPPTLAGGRALPRTLTIVDFSHSPTIAKQFLPVLGALRALRELWLAFADLGDADIELLTRLPLHCQLLVLSGNALTHADFLDDETVRLLRLERLVLHNNRLRRLPRRCSAAPQLKQLDVTDNAQLHRIPTELAQTLAERGGEVETDAPQAVLGEFGGKPLFIGNGAFSTDSLAVLDIAAVVSLCAAADVPPSARAAAHHLHIDIEDDESADLLAHVDRIVAFVEQHRAGGVLAHCVVGQSRSAAALIAFAIAQLGATRHSALAALRRVRPMSRPNAGFWRQLEELERRERAAAKE